MAIKTIPIFEEDTLELYYKAKVKFVNENIQSKITDENILREALKSYLGDS